MLKNLAVSKPIIFNLKHGEDKQGQLQILL